MISDILDDIEDRLEEIDDLTILQSPKQIKESETRPIAIINVDGQTIIDKNNWKKYKVGLSIQIYLIHTELSSLYDLIEEVESNLNLSTKFSGTMDFDYKGWTLEKSELGSNDVGATLSLSVVYIKT